MISWLTGAASPPPRDIFAEVTFKPLSGAKARSAPEKLAFKTALLTGGSKLIHDLHADSWELYDLAGDPDEQRNIFTVGDSRHERMQRRLGAWENPRRTRWQRPGDDVGRPDADEMERLRSLGYAN